MLASEIISDVRAELLEPSAAFWTDARLLALLNLAEKELVQRTRILQSSAWLDTIAGEKEYPMPANWLGSEKIFYKDSNGNWKPLEPTTLEKLSQIRPNFLSSETTDRGTPSRYYIHNRALMLDPIPDTSGSGDIFMFYESMPTSLTLVSQQINIDVSLSPALRAYILWKAWAQDQEPERASEQRDLFFEMVGQAHGWKKKLQRDGRWMIDIQSSIPFSYGGSSRSGINPLDM